MDAAFSDAEKGHHACPKFDTCSAPICPLDAQWSARRHLPGERICLWLREAVKPGGDQALREALPITLVEHITAALPAIQSSNSDIRHKLRQAAAAGSKRGAPHG